jgi:hypothetical protein
MKKNEQLFLELSMSCIQSFIKNAQVHMLAGAEAGGWPGGPRATLDSGKKTFVGTVAHTVA